MKERKRRKERKKGSPKIKGNRERKNSKEVDEIAKSSKLCIRNILTNVTSNVLRVSETRLCSLEAGTLYVCNKRMFALWLTHTVD
jgi:hypothetical protein